MISARAPLYHTHKVNTWSIYLSIYPCPSNTLREFFFYMLFVEEGEWGTLALSLYLPRTFPPQLVNSEANN